MRFTLLIILCAISFTTSAQFWHRKPKPQEQQRFPLLEEVTPNLAISFTPVTTITDHNIHDLHLHRSNYDLELAEQLALQEAKHNMHIRMYNLASYNFSELAALYVQQNRFSEAKWYLLQSNSISRLQDDTKHTLANLLALADIKVKIGEITLAKLDLQEAHDLASLKGMQADLAEINKIMQYLQNNKIAAVKAELRYDEAVEAANSRNKKLSTPL